MSGVSNAPLAIVAFKWGRKYSSYHVNVMRRMVARNLRLGHEFVCVTDDPAGLDPEIRIVPFGTRIWRRMRGAKLHGVRCRAFGADMAEIIGPRFAWIDLDVVITGDITPLLDRPEDFVITATPRPPLPYNASMVLMTAGSRREVHERWTEADYHRLGEQLGRERGVPFGTVSDEGWITVCLGDDEATWGTADGVYYFRHHLDRGRRRLPADARMVIMNGKAYDPALRQWQVLAPWICEHWR